MDQQIRKCSAFTLRFVLYQIFSVVLLYAYTACNSVSAQDRVTGKVNDTGGSPIIGANVLIAGTTNGTITDVDGKFALEVPDIKTTQLSISYIGYLNELIDLNGRSYIETVLTEDVTQLEELVVIGYGVQSKKVVTGAISSIKSDEITQTPVLRIEQAMQGRLPGVNVSNQSGQPGDAPSVIIRGSGTNGSSMPLYVVDGMIVGGIDYLNPGDIESIEVLKDAASAAIYGARAANGVVLITTKGGTKGDATVTYGGYYGVQNAWKKIPVLNAREYAILMNEGAAAGGFTMPYSDPSVYGEGTDWQDAVFSANAPIMNQQISVSGGSEKSTYASTLSYFSQEGIVGGKKSKFDRYTFRLNSSHKVGNNLNFGNNISYTHINRRAVDSNSEWGSPLSNALNLDPITPLYETDPARLATYDARAVRNGSGQFYGISPYVTQEIVNPLARLEVTHGNTRVDKIVGNVFGELTFLKDFNFRTNYGVDLGIVGGNFYRPEYYLNAAQVSDESMVDKNYDRYLTWLWENTITYNKRIGNHNISGLLGMSSQEILFDGLFGSKADLIIDDPRYAYINAALDEESMRAGGGASHESIVSYFGRATYDYANKYLFTGIVRVDGSSKFGTNNRYGVFPSVSAGWVLSEEDFLAPLASTMNFLKIRASWGQNGNDRIGNYRWTSVIETGAGYTFGQNETFTSGAKPAFVPNPDLRWETSEQLDIGIDAGFFNDKLLFTIDYYDKRTKDLLIVAPIPGHVGNNAPFVNGGTVQNRGIEVALDYRTRVRDFNLSTNVNFAYNANEVLEINNAEGVIFGAGFATYGTITRMQEGLPIGYFWGLKTDGIFQNQSEIEAHRHEGGSLIQPDARPGDVRFLDLDGNGRIDDGDRTMIGNPTPKWTYGFSLNADFKGFDLAIFFQGAHGMDIFNGTRRHDLATTNMPATFLDRWTGEGTSNEMPRLTWNDTNGNWTRISDLYIENGSYLRMRNIQLGYNLPATAINWMHVRKARVYISGDNLLTITNYNGYDPEIGPRSAFDLGIDRGVYPQPRIYRMGLSVTF
ncbi:MAG: SusC/RagA family TonB-linked outer membrane protein [Cyclobacteriaceae bacterium]